MELFYSMAAAAAAGTAVYFISTGWRSYRARRAAYRRTLKRLQMTAPSAGGGTRRRRAPSWLRAGFGLKLQNRIVASGLKVEPAVFLVDILALGVSVLFVVYWLSASAPAAVSAAIAVYMGVYYWLGKRAAQYRERLRGQLPAALTATANSLSAGASFPQALAYAVEEVQPPLRLELLKVVEWLGVGMSLEEALVRLCRETKVEELEQVVSALIIQRRSGGNTAKLFQSTSKLLRQKNKLRQELQVQTAQTRFSGKVIGLMPLAVIGFLLLTAPDFIMPLFHTGLGLLILGMAAAAETAGFLIIRRILRIGI